MNIQVLYCSHEQSDLEMREKIAFPNGTVLREAYTSLKEKFPDSEHVLLSTCNRVEIYSAQEEDVTAPSREQMFQFLSDFHRIPIDGTMQQIPNAIGEEAVRHLFRVTSGLDSMVLGEPQIVNQVKQAYRVAQENEACGTLTHALFQDAISVSARVRSMTALAEGKISIASVAVGEFGKNIFDTFQDKLVLVIGAGEMAEEAIVYLKDEGATDLVIVNRRVERAERLAAEVGGEPKPITELEEWLTKADIIVSATGAVQPIVDVPMFAATRKQNQAKSVFILDLGAPRDFDPAIADIDDNIFLFDIDDLEQTCQRNRNARKKEIASGEKIVEEQTVKFIHSINHLATGPVVKELREQWHDVRDLELERLFAKIDHLEPTDRDQIKHAMDRVINKILHPPMQALKNQSKEGTPHGLLDALRHLFKLSDE